MDDKNKDFVNGMVIGGVVGIVLGLMIAPNSGEKTRESLLDKLEYIKEFVGKEARVVGEKVGYKSKKAVKKTKKK